MFMFMFVDLQKPLVHVRDIVIAHWKSYGRNYYSRYDYEGVSTQSAQLVMHNMKANMHFLHQGQQFGSFQVYCVCTMNVDGC